MQKLSLTTFTFPTHCFFQILLILFLLVPLLSACQKASGPQELRFETIAAGENVGSPNLGDRGGYSSSYPSLLVLTSVEDILNLPSDIRFGDEVIAKLEAVDFQKNFVVVVLRGLLGGWSPYYTPEVMKVTREDDLVTVYTHFGNPRGVGMAFSAPYTAIQVSKTGKWGQNIRFTMRIDDEGLSK